MNKESESFFEGIMYAVYKFCPNVFDESKYAQIENFELNNDFSHGAFWAKEYLSAMGKEYPNLIKKHFAVGCLALGKKVAMGHTEI